MTSQLRWIATLFLVCAVATSGPKSAAAQGSRPAMTTEELLNRWAAAIGGRKILESARTIHIRGTIESGGLKGTFETWTKSTGAVRLTVTMSRADHQVRVYDGHDGWFLDSSDTVQKLSELALKSLVTTAYEQSDSFLFSDRMRGRVIFSGDDPVRNAYIVVFRPEGGSSTTLYLNKKTFLPSEEKPVDPRENHTITYSDWREFGGMMFPGTIRKSNGNTRFDETSKTEQVEINSEIGKNLFDKPEEEAAEIHFDHGAHKIVIPVEVFTKSIYVPVRLNSGETSWFWLNSGSQGSVVSKWLAEKNGILSPGAMEVQGAANSTLGFAKNVMLNLPGAYFPAKSVAVIDVSEWLPEFGRAFDGILGYDFFRRLVVRVDYESKQITLYDPATFVPSKNATSLAITFVETLPIVSVKILLAGRAPIDTKCAIASGGGGLVLAAPFVKANQILASVPKRISFAESRIGGRVTNSKGRIEGLQFGTMVLRNPVVTFSVDTKGILAGNEFGALIGGVILNHFVVTFDYPHQRVLLEPNHNFHDPFLANETGLSLIATGKNFERIEADFVEPGSPAAAAGLLKGDIFMQIDGHATSDFNLDTIDALFEQTGRTIQLMVKRGDSILTLKIKLEQRI